MFTTERRGGRGIAHPRGDRACTRQRDAVLSWRIHLWAWAGQRGRATQRDVWRGRVVAYGRVAPDPTASTSPLAAGPEGTKAKSGSAAWSWAALMHRAFAIDVLACPHCGGRLRLIATLHDPAVIRKLLAHLGMARSGPSPGPAPPEPAGVTP